MVAQIVIVGVVAVFFLVRLTIALRGRSGPLRSLRAAEQGGPQEGLTERG